MTHDYMYRCDMGPYGSALSRVRWALACTSVVRGCAVRVRQGLLRRELHTCQLLIGYRHVYVLLTVAYIKVAGLWGF